MYSLIENPNESFFMAYGTDIILIKKMSFWEFHVWYVDEVLEDWKYVKEGGKIYLMFIFPIEIFDRKKIPFLKPKYPWNMEILSSFKFLEEKEKSILKVNESLRKENIELRKEIENLKKK